MKTCLCSFLACKKLNWSDYSLSEEEELEELDELEELPDPELEEEATLARSFPTLLARLGFLGDFFSTAQGRFRLVVLAAGGSAADAAELLGPAAELLGPAAELLVAAAANSVEFFLALCCLGGLPLLPKLAKVEPSSALI